MPSRFWTIECPPTCASRSNTAPFGLSGSFLQRLFVGRTKIGKRKRLAGHPPRLRSATSGPERPLQISPAQGVCSCVERLDGIHQMDTLPEIGLAIGRAKQRKALKNEIVKLALQRSHMSWVHTPDAPLKGLLSTDMLLLVIGPKSGDFLSDRSSCSSQSQLPQRFARTRRAHTTHVHAMPQPYDWLTRCGMARSGTPIPRPPDASSHTHHEARRARCYGKHS